MNASSNAMLAAVTPGFRDVVHGAQQTYRVLLAAMSRPGQNLRLPTDAIAGVNPPPSLGIGMTAILLSLLDAETVVALRGRCHSAAAESYLRFHTGARMTGAADSAAFVVARLAQLDAALWSCLETGSDEAPQLGATLLLEVDAFDADAGSGTTTLSLRGPGIEHETPLVVAGLPAAFVTWRIDLQRRMPRGVDLVLVCGDRVVALPRSTRIHAGSR